MRLQKLQKEFAAHLYDSKKDKIFAVITSSKAPVHKRLQIYRNNVFGNFDNVLEMIYPKIKELVGENYFYDLENLYHQKYRSPTGNLDDYGKNFPSLISTLKKEHQLPYLHDVAKLEWLYHRTYFSKDGGPIDIKKLQNLPQKDYYKVKFDLHPSCRLMSSQYPICSIWSKKKKVTIKEKSGKEKSGKENSGEMILAERCNFKSYIHQLSAVEYQFLEMVKKKNNIYQIYKILSKNNADFDIGLLINKYILNGVLARFYTS